MSSKEEHYPGSVLSQTLPRRIRWLAAAAGCATGIALLGLSWILSLSAIFLILGAVIPRRFPRAGRWFILAPALLLGVLVLPICFANPVEMIRDLFVGPRDFNYLAMSVSWVLSPILLIWCITAVLRDLVKHGHRLL
jgi:hypothetical protein